MSKEELLMLLMLYGISAEKIGDVLVAEIIKQIDNGVPVITAIDNALAQTGFIKGYSENLIDAICIAAYLGYGFPSTTRMPSNSITSATSTSISRFTSRMTSSTSTTVSSSTYQLSNGTIELAPTIPQIKTAKQLAMEQGLVPTIMIGDGIKDKVLSESWAADNMNLSTRLHGAEPKMRQAIIDTLSAGMRQGKTVKDMAMDLYDGYNSGKQVIQSAELPGYLRKLKSAARSAASGDPAMTRELNKAIDNASGHIEKLNSKELKAAYKQVVDAAKDLNIKVMEKAAWVAVQEKSRYHADRIATTEMARAWSDGFFAKHDHDPRVIGYRWRLSSKHPRFDICDFHATADLYGMGEGVYPKDKVPPHPAHPYCHCNLQPVYKGEATPGEFNADAGKEWLQKQSRYNRQQLLGIEGNRTFENGGDWQKFLRNWNGHSNPSDRFKPIDFHSEKADIKDVSLDKFTAKRYNDIIKQEPQITKDIQSAVIRAGGSMEGLEYRIKAKDSFIRKVETDYNLAKLENHEITPLMIANKINDAIRYTAVANGNAFYAMYDSTIKQLINDGYSLVKVKNTWNEDMNPYKGVNVILKSPNRQSFELQFHTPQSFDMKQNKIHSLYEEYRLGSTSLARKRELSKMMRELSRSLKKPDNIDLIN
jgi:hypothetical protein